MSERERLRWQMDGKLFLNLLPLKLIKKVYFYSFMFCFFFLDVFYVLFIIIYLFFEATKIK